MTARTASMILLLALATPAVQGAAPSYAKIVADPGRPGSDREQDGARKPAEMLAFAQVKPGMIVADLLPGGGYFTRLFSDAVGAKGKVYAWGPDELVQRAPKAMDAVKALAADKPAHGNVEVVSTPMAKFSLPKLADAVWTSRNYHDFYNSPGADPVAFNKRVFAALKPGGEYLILDHSGAAGTGTTQTKDLHRIDPAAVKRDVEAAGFKFEAEDRALANPDDPKTGKVFDPALRGHTDQFVLRFRKPR